MTQHAPPTVAPQNPAPQPGESPAGESSPSVAARVRYFLLREAIIPTTKRSFAAFLLWSQMGAPLAMMAYPTGEDALKQAGLDPALVQQMGADHVRVLPPTPMGNFLHTSMLKPPALALLYTYLNRDTPQELQGLATRGLFNITGKLTGFCAVILPSPDNYNVSQTLSGLSGYELFKSEIHPDLPYTAQQSFAHTALHEFRHCAQDLPITASEDELMQEADADAQAALVLAQEFGSVQVPYTKIYARALNIYTKSHDTALYADAAMQGRPLPTSEEIKSSAQEVSDYVSGGYKRLLRKGQSLSLTTSFADTVFKLALEHKDESGLSPLALRRAQLYVDGYAYLTGGAPQP